MFTGPVRLLSGTFQLFPILENYAGGEWRASSGEGDAIRGMRLCLGRALMGARTACKKARMRRCVGFLPVRKKAGTKGNIHLSPLGGCGAFRPFAAKRKF